MSEMCPFSKMSDSKSIVRFVKDIERHPCLYNPKSFLYVDRELKRRTWIHIAKRLNASVAECKEKWRKIRTAYSRSLKPKYQNGVRIPSRPYYLASYLKFITPREKRSLVNRKLQLPAKNRKIPSNPTITEIKNEAESKSQEKSDDSIAELENQDENPNDPSEQMFLEEYISFDDDDNEDISLKDTGTINKETISSEVNHKPKDKEIRNRNNQNNDNIRERCTYCVNIERKPRKMFLFSLLPDIEALADHQMRSFRRGLIDLIDKCRYLEE